MLTRTLLTTAMRLRVLRLVVVAAATFSFAVGCDRTTPTGPTQPPPPAPIVVSVTVTGATPIVGATSQMTAMATLSNNTSTNVTSLATWRVSNSAVATVSGTGMVTGSGAGSVDITATYEAVAGSIRLTVPQPVIPTFALSGRVLDGTSGAAIANADVRVTAGPGANTGKSARTDGTGRYTILQLVAGTCTLRADANQPAYETLDRTVAIAADTQLDFSVPRVPVTPPPPPPPAPAPPTGTGAFVRVETDSLTCGCSRGTITITAGSATLGTTTCSTGSRTFDIAPGTYTFTACDSLGCWRTVTATLSRGDTQILHLTCTTSATMQKVTRLPDERQ